MPTPKRPSALTTNRSRRSVVTPLGIIAAFVGLSETVTAVAAVKTDGSIQLLFAVFSVAFPTLIASLFFLVLWKRSYVFYPPQDFGANVDVRQYVDAMRHQAIGTQEVFALVRKSIEDGLNSNEGTAALARAASQNGTTPSTIKEAAVALTQSAMTRFEESVLTVSLVEFPMGGAAVPDLVFPYDPDEGAFELLSAVYFQISEHVDAFAYGQTWALEDRATGQRILPAGINWRDKHPLANSNATVKDLGLRPGMRLAAVPLP